MFRNSLVWSLAASALVCVLSTESQAQYSGASSMDPSGRVSESWTYRGAGYTVTGWRNSYQPNQGVSNGGTYWCAQCGRYHALQTRSLCNPRLNRRCTGAPDVVATTRCPKQRPRRPTTTCLKTQIGTGGLGLRIRRPTPRGLATSTQAQGQQSFTVGSCSSLYTFPRTTVPNRTDLKCGDLQ